MQYYNCFSYRFFDNIVLNHNIENGYSLEKNTIYKVAAIPIKFDKTYTIAIDSTSPVSMKAFFHDNLNFLNKKVDLVDYPVVNLLNDALVYINDYVVTNSNCFTLPQSSINNPIYYKISTKKSENIEEDFSNSYKRSLLDLEKYLYLLIQLPKNSSSSITVLEGKYSNKDFNKNYYNIDFKSLDNPNNVSMFQSIQDVIDDILDSKTDFIRSNISNPDNPYDYVGDVNPYDSSIIYNIGDYCYYSNQLYMCIANDTTGDWNSNKWIYISYDDSDPTALSTILSLLDFCYVSDKNKYLSNKLSLLEFSCSNTYAFNDRLVEYLLLNVIDNTETIDDNVTRIQKVLDITNRKDVIPSVWSDLLRYLLFKKYFKSNLEKSFDISGFVDKDIEKLLVKMDGDF